MAGTNSPIILNNKVIVPINAALAAAYINIQSFGNNQFSQATFPSLQNPVNYGPGVGVRFADSRGYILWYGNSASQVSLWRQDDASTWVQIGSNSSTLTISPTDIWKIEASGSAIAGYQNGTQVVQTFDNTYSSGRPGIWLYYNFNELDDFTCGYVSNVDLTQHQVLAVNNATQLQSSGNVVLTQHQILSVDDCYSTSQVDGAGSVGVIDVTIGANEDDGGWRGDADSFYQNHYNNIDVGYVWSGMFRGFFRFDNLTISGTIITAHVTLQAYSTQTLDGSVIYAVDASDPAAPTTKAEAEGATRTTEHVHWANGTQTINVDYDTPELKNIIQELVDSYTFNGTQGKSVV